MSGTGKLPPHLSAEWAAWAAWCERTGNDPSTPTKRSVALYGAECLASTTLAQRHASLNAIRQASGRAEAFDYPYPLLVRWIPVEKSLGAILARIRRDSSVYAYGANAACIMLLRARVGDGVEVSNNVACVNGTRVVPVTNELVGWIRQTGGKVGYPPGWVSVSDLHGALAAELDERGVPETQAMALYGRRSAMKYRVARRRVGLFRVPVLDDGSYGA